MEKRTPRATLTISTCGNRIPITAELLSILDVPTDGVLWKKTESEYYLFSEKTWNKFVQQMKATKSDKTTYFEYTREGRNFMRGLYDRAGTVMCSHDGIHIPSHTKKKIIQNKKFTIEIYR